MTRILLIIMLLLNIKIGLAQEVKGVAQYVIKQSSEGIEEVLNNPDMDPQMRKFIESKMESALTKSYTLVFNSKMSKFQEQEQVSISDEDTDLSWSPYGIDVAFYKNIASQNLVVEKDLMGKTFYVNEALPQFKWQLTDETKSIGSFLCKKAIVEIPVSEEEKKEFEEEKAAYEKNKTQFFELKEPTPKQVTAWYTTDVPVMNGPFEYGGLPGLILEVNDGEDIVVCTKITLDPKLKTDVSLPSRAKTISKDEFDKISLKKLKELESQN